MSNVVQFLETLARNPKPLSDDELVVAVAEAGLESTIGRAVIDRNAEALAQKLGRCHMMCIIVPAENDEPVESDEKDGDNESPETETSSLAA